VTRRRALVLTALLLAAGASVFLVCQRETQLEEPPSQAGHAAKIEAPLPVRAESTAAERARITQPQSAPAPASEPDGKASVVIESYAINLRVVDASGAGVPGARVEAWDMVRLSHEEATLFRALRKVSQRESRQGDPFGFERPDRAPLQSHETDENGRCRIQLDHEHLFVMASRKGLGDAGMVVFWQASRALEQVLTLLPLVPLSVLVLRADGTPAAGALVVATHATNSPPQRTDHQGRCRFELLQRTLYRFHAKEHDQQTFVESVSTMTDASPGELVLRFRGCLTISGMLLDANGWPAQGTVRVWERASQEQRAEDYLKPFSSGERTNNDGTWRIDLPRTGTFDLIGEAHDHANSDAAAIVITDGARHARVDLRLLAAATIQGVVTRDDGTPVANVRLALSPEATDTGETAGAPSPSDRFGISSNVRSDAAGKFTFRRVHPRPTYTVVCNPEPEKRHLRVTQTGVVPGAEVRIVVKNE
jgi:protocatechuate 3,4-dioxygenase beta subunit